MRYLLFLSIILLFGGGCAKTMPQGEKITFQTSDGVMIVGTYVNAGESAPQALLLHMMPATKESYAAFAEKLRAAGISSLAIDFRGHGESVKKSTDNSLPAGKAGSQFTVLDYQNFTDAEQQAKILDVRAAVDWLVKKYSAHKNKIAIVGASIGANLALQYLMENPEVPVAVLLSPGLDYRGIKIEPLARVLKLNQALYLAASADDPESFSAIAKLAQVTPAKHITKEFQHAGHGTTMFENEPEFMDEVAKWIEQQIK